jgi:hypothetical protein
VITLGDRCRDTITGFEGTATARYEFINGCIRYNLETSSPKEGVLELVFDEQRLEVVQDATEEPVVKRTGGARDQPAGASSRDAPPRTGVR